MLHRSPTHLYLFFSLVLLLFTISCDQEPVSPFEGLRVRKDAKDMTAREKADFVEAVLLLKATPSPYSDTLSFYDQFVRFHQMAVEKKICTTLGVAHANPAFPAWHRKMLILYEDALREVSGKDITLPYWNWTDPESTAAVFSDDLMGGNGDPGDEYAVNSGPFRKGEFQINLFTIRPDFLSLNPHPWLVRNFGATLPGNAYPGYEVNLPTEAEVSNCLSIDTYDMPPWDCSGSGNTSFRFCLEGFTGGTCPGQQAMHNIGHDWVAGFFEIPVDSIQMIPVEAINPFCGLLMRDTVPNNVRVGSMEPLDVSPNDPAFFLHHCNVDRIWAEWQSRPGNGMKYEPVTNAPDGYKLNDQMYPFDQPQFRGRGSMDAHGLTPASMLSTVELGYAYE